MRYVAVFALLSLLLGTFLGAGCGRTGAMRIVSGGAVDPIDPGRFAAGRVLLEGLPRPAVGDTWRVGDSVLLGIAMDTAEGAREWYVRVTAKRAVPESEVRVAAWVQPQGRGEPLRFTFSVAEVNVELFDGAVQLISQSTAHVPELCLDRGGLFEFAEVLMEGQTGQSTWRLASAESDDQVRLVAAGMVSMMRIPDFLQGDPAMDQLIWRIIDRPGVLSVIANRGVNLRVAYMDDAEIVPEPDALFAPALRAPLAVVLNERPALHCQIVVMQSAPPYGICNGLLALDAVHPTDPQRRLAVRLLGAQRGPAEPLGGVVLRSTRMCH